MIDYEETRFFYDTTSAWDTDLYGTYTPKYIRRFITRELNSLPVDTDTKILNAGSGGTEYYNKGNQYHIDLAGSKLKGIKNAVVGNLIDTPWPDGYFDIIIMAGCVMSYCESDKAIKEMTRVLKPGGFIVLDYERTGSGVLPFFLRKLGRFQSRYRYVGKLHRSYLYSDKRIHGQLEENGLRVLRSARFNVLYAITYPFSQFFTRKYIERDMKLSANSFWRRYAHNEILIARKEGK
jgi:SAM-dependent methyltransferase